jgi:DNA primase
MIVRSEQLKETLSMLDVAQRYGFTPNRGGFIRCPFHADKTASLKIYKESGKGWHCFGCGKGGTVIDFAMQLFDLDFKAACERLCSDFSLGIATTQISKKQLEEMHRKRQQEEVELKSYRNRYIDKECLYADLLEARELYKPKYQGRPLNPLFARALTELPAIEYWLDTHEWR